MSSYPNNPIPHSPNRPHRTQIPPFRHNSSNDPSDRPPRSTPVHQNRYQPDDTDDSLFEKDRDSPPHSDPASPILSHKPSQKPGVRFGPSDSAQVNSSFAHGSSAANPNMRRKKSLVRPDRAPIDPSHRLYNYRNHAVAMQADERGHVGLSNTGMAAIDGSVAWVPGQLDSRANLPPSLQPPRNRLPARPKKQKHRYPRHPDEHHNRISSEHPYHGNRQLIKPTRGRVPDSRPNKFSRNWHQAANDPPAFDQSKNKPRNNRPDLRINPPNPQGSVMSKKTHKMIDFQNTDNISAGNFDSPGNSSSHPQNEETASSNDEDAEAIADVLLGRKAHPRLLLSWGNHRPAPEQMDEKSQGPLSKEYDSYLFEQSVCSSTSSQLSAPILDRVSWKKLAPNVHETAKDLGCIREAKFASNSSQPSRPELPSDHNSRRKCFENNNFDRELPSRPRADRRPPREAHQTSRRHYRSRSRSPHCRGICSPPPNCRNWGRSSLSPRRRLRCRNNSPPFHHRSHPSERQKPPRRMSPPGYARNRPRDLREDSSDFFPSPAFGGQESHHHGYSHEASMPSNKLTAALNSHTSGGDIKLGSSHWISVSSETSAIQTTDRVSVLVSNLPPSNLSLRPREIYEYLVHSADAKGDIIHPPIELILYRFAGTNRLCAELKFKSEGHARAFGKQSSRPWPTEWYGCEQKPVSNSEKVEFTVVESDRTPWPREHEIYRPNEPNQVEKKSSINLEEKTACTREFGPPTPTSFRSPIIGSQSLDNETFSSIVPNSASAVSNSEFPSVKESSEVPSLTEPKEKRGLTGVLLSGLKPSVKASVLQSHFVAPTRPRHFRMFEIIWVSCGALVPGGSTPIRVTENNNACLIELKDDMIAKSFFQTLEENKPFDPMEINLVDPREIKFGPPASIIGGQNDRTSAPRPHIHPDRRELILESQKSNSEEGPSLATPTLAETNHLALEAEKSFVPLSQSTQEPKDRFEPKRSWDNHQNPHVYSLDNVMAVKNCWDTQVLSTAQELPRAQPMSEISLNRAEQLRQALLARRSGQP